MMDARTVAFVVAVVVGWLAATGAGIAAYRGRDEVARLHAEVAVVKGQSETWHRKAGKAYAAYLHAQAHGVSVIPLPQGAGISCLHTPHGVLCDPNVIDPPADY